MLQDVAFGPGMHVDVAVGAIIGAQAAADAVALDLNLLALAVAVNGIDGAADEAIGIGARPATAGYQPLVNSQAVANQPRDAIVRIAASFGAFVAASASFQIQNEQSLRVVEPLIDELAA